MKWYFLSAFALVNISIFGQQNISDYQYIYVPKKFADFKTDNQYKLNTALASALKAKKYQVLQDDPENWPNALKLEPCKVLTAQVKNNSNMLRNRVILDFSDCKKNEVKAIKATSMEKEFEAGYNDALRQALATVPVSDPKERIEMSATSVSSTKSNTSQVLPAKEVEAVVQSSSPAKETKSADYELSSQSTTGAEMFTLNNENFQKVKIGNGGFILVSPKSSVPFATFQPSAKEGVYRVSLNDGSMTLGYQEKENLVIEMPNSNGTFTNLIFIKN